MSTVTAWDTIDSLPESDRARRYNFMRAQTELVEATGEYLAAVGVLLVELKAHSERLPAPVRAALEVALGKQGIRDTARRALFAQIGGRT